MTATTMVGALLVPAALAHTLPIWKARAAVYKQIVRTYSAIPSVVDENVTECWRMSSHVVYCNYVVHESNGNKCFGTASAYFATKFGSQIAVRRVKIRCA